MELEIEGVPIAQCRPRFGKGRIYDPRGVLKAELQNILKEKTGKEALEGLYNESLSVDITLYTPIPKSLSNNRRKSMEGCFDSNKPDIDNYVKFYLDLLNGWVWKDDRQVVDLHVCKIKSSEPKVKIRISKAEAEKT